MKQIKDNEVYIIEELQQQNTQILQLETRLNSLENIVNTIQKRYPAYWDVID